MVGYLIQSCDISHETTHFKLELFASSSFTYEAKIIMLANGFGLEPIPNYQVPCTVSWTAVVLCQAHIGHYPQPFLFFVWCQLGWHLLSVIFCHLPITYQFSFVLLEVHDINPPPSYQQQQQHGDEWQFDNGHVKIYCCMTFWMTDYLDFKWPLSALSF